MRPLALLVACLLLAGCGSENRDKLPDDLTSAEGADQPTPVIDEEESTDLAPEDNGAGAPEPPAPASNIVEDPLAPLPPRPELPRPSFDCEGPLNRVEAMVCGDPQLAILDQRLAREYSRALEDSSPEQRQRLTNLGRRYLGDRNRCATRDCILQSYRWYLRDIESVMDWQGQ